MTAPVRSLQSCWGRCHRDEDYNDDEEEDGDDDKDDDDDYNGDVDKDVDDDYNGDDVYVCTTYKSGMIIEVSSCTVKVTRRTLVYPYRALRSFSRNQTA